MPKSPCPACGNPFRGQVGTRDARDARARDVLQCLVAATPEGHRPILRVAEDRVADLINKTLRLNVLFFSDGIDQAVTQAYHQLYSRGGHG